jgi:NADH-quinone oxidoreductase subunit C
MEEKKIVEKVKAAFPQVEIDLVEENTDHPYMVVPPDALVDVCRHLKDDDELRMETLTCLSGVDDGETLTSVYHLFSYTHGHYSVLKVRVPKTSPAIPTVEKIWPGANWFERESFDLLGIVYEGHSDLRRIMMPDDWVGHPLRKDYVEQEEYHGMGTSRTNPLDIG